MGEYGLGAYLIVNEGFCVSETRVYNKSKSDLAVSLVRQARGSNSGIREQVAIWLPAIQSDIFYVVDFNLNKVVFKITDYHY